MTGWIKFTNEVFTYEVQCINTKKNLVRDLHAADVRYHLDCWLDVNKIQACWSGAIVTTFSSIIYKSGTSATDIY